MTSILRKYIKRKYNKLLMIYLIPSAPGRTERVIGSDRNREGIQRKDRLERGKSSQEPESSSLKLHPLPEPVYDVLSVCVLVCYVSTSSLSASPRFCFVFFPNVSPLILSSSPFSSSLARAYIAKPFPFSMFSPLCFIYFSLGL